MSTATSKMREEGCVDSETFNSFVLLQRVHTVSEERFCCALPYEKLRRFEDHNTSIIQKKL